MFHRLEEEPEPAEEEAPQQSGLVPTVEPGGRTFEYRTDVISSKQLADGKTLPELLTKASSEDWDLVEVIASGDRHVVLLRKLKRQQAESRRVGFSLRGQLALGDPRPIGVFDSGVGGLTVLRAIHDRMPWESTIYVGDLLHFPYGPRYQDEVKRFAFDIVRYLQARDVKLVVIACNTATAAALHQAREVFDLPIVGVISPGAQAAVQATQRGLVGVISTEGTRMSQEYLHAIKELDPMVGVYQKACPQLVDIVEAGEADSPRAEAALGRDLLEIASLGADVLVLGCTHYPLLKPAIRRLFPQLQLVDSAQTTAGMVERRLDHARMRADGSAPPRHELLVTAVPERFNEVAAVLFGERVPEVQEVVVWERL